MHFAASRPLRFNESEAFKLYKHIVEDGLSTPPELVRAVKAEIEMRKSQSFIRNENLFRYMKAICNWLSEGIYQAFLEVPEENDRTNPGIYSQLR